MATLQDMLRIPLQAIKTVACQSERREVPCIAAQEFGVHGSRLLITILHLGEHPREVGIDVAAE